MFHLLSFLLLVSLLAAPAIGQVKESSLCSKVELEVLRPLEPSKVGRRVAYDDECIFSFTVGGNERVSLYIEKYETEEKSRKAFTDEFDTLTVYENEQNRSKYRNQNINKDCYWNEAIAYRRDRPEHLMFLRYQNFTIVLLSSNYGLLEKIEPLLRNIRFEKY